MSGSDSTAAASLQAPDMSGSDWRYKKNTVGVLQLCCSISTWRGAAASTAACQGDKRLKKKRYLERGGRLLRGGAQLSGSERKFF
jgi:hypothetical protein